MMQEAIGLAMPQGEALKPSPGDTVIIDGVEVCAVCGEPRTKRINWAGREMVVPCACACIVEAERKKAEREEAQERIRRIDRLRGLSMMPGKYRQSTFANSRDGGKAIKIARGYVDNWPKMEREQQGLLFFGPVGTGKSYAASCIANELLDREVPVLVTSIIKVLAIDNDDSNMIRASVRAARLVIIDDLGAERSTDYACEQTFDFIDTVIREGKPMIVTTNLTMRDMVEEKNLKKKRVYDRVLEVCCPVAVDGKSRRMESAARRQAEVRKLLGG